MRNIAKIFIGLILVFLPQIAEASSGGYYVGFMMLESCAILSDDYRDKSQSIISRWKENEPDLFEKFENYSESELITPDHKARIENFSVQEMRDAKKNCDEIFANMEAKLEPADDRFSSPEKTWALFLRSLKSGDKVTIAKCLSGRAQQNFASFFENRNKTQLKEMGESYTGFQIMGDMGELQDAMVTRSNGRAGVILFAKQGSNWKIADM